MKYKLRLMQRLYHTDRTIIYITENDDDMVYIFDELIDYERIQNIYPPPLIDGSSIKYIRIYVCFDLIKEFTPFNKHIEDFAKRVELEAAEDIKIQELLRVNNSISKDMLSKKFIRFFEQLVDDYIFEVNGKA